ncbi:MAG: ribonuclease R [Hyphomonadaceae bacterium]
MTVISKEIVLGFLKDNPQITTKRDIARALHVSGKGRTELRAILKELEADGKLERTAKRSYARADQPPPTGIIAFERIDEHGDLIGRMSGRDGPFGPEIIYAGVQGKRKIPEPGVGDRALCKVSETAQGWRAKLIKKLSNTETSELTGLYTTMRNGGGRVAPANRKDRREVVIEAKDAGKATDGDLVVARLKPSGRGRAYGPKLGIITEIIGKSDDPKAASILAIHAHGIPVDFPDEVIAAAKTAEPAKVKREDLTQIPLITIDPPDARDHDDAVFAEQLDDGWRVIVAIADVSAYVTEGSALDREAQMRGNSTYFPDRVVPMLPEELSADACSLREKELRACMAVEMIFDKSGSKRKHRFIRGTMRSAAKLSYNEAQNAIDGLTGGPGDAMLDHVLKPLWAAYSAMCVARDKRQPLDLDLPERRVELGDDGRVEAITQRERFDAHRLIEEMMIAANVCAAETLEKSKTPLIYRIHDQPSDAKISALADFLQTLNIKWARGEPPQTHRFNTLLGEAGSGEHKDVVTEMVLRSQAQAVYAPDNIGHFGLHLAKYAHFTSPIRRYSDLLVHRALIRAMQLGPDGLGDENAARMEELAEHLSTTERRSMAAEREATDRYLAHFMADRVGAEFEGRIAGLNKAGLFIKLAETGADGFVPISRLSDEYWVHDERSQALVTRGSGQRYELGQTVSVKLAEATPLTGGLLLEMLSKPLPRKAGSKAPAGRKGKPSDGRRKGGKAAKHRRRKQKR